MDPLTVTRAEGTVQSIYASSSHTIEDITVDAVEGRRVTAYTQHFVRDQTVERYAVDGRMTEDVQHGPLEGKTVTHRWSNLRWDKSLKAGLLNRITAEEQAALDGLVSDIVNEDSYPSEPVSVGHRWTMDSTQLRRLLGVHSGSLQGEAKLLFKSVAEVQGDVVATIEVSMELKGKGVNPDGGEYAGEFSGTGTYTRSLSRGTDKGSFTGYVSNERLEVEDGRQIHVRVAAPISVTSESWLFSSNLAVPPAAKPVINEGLIWRVFAPVLARNAPALGRILWLGTVGALFGGLWFLWNLVFGRRRSAAPSSTAKSSSARVK